MVLNGVYSVLRDAAAVVFTLLTQGQVVVSPSCWLVEYINEGIIIVGDRIAIAKGDM